MPASTNTNVASANIPSGGLWLLISVMQLSISIPNNSYNHAIEAQTVRGVSVNGGGNINCMIVLGGSTFKINAIVPQACNVIGKWQAIRIR